MSMNVGFNIGFSIKKFYIDTRKIEDLVHKKSVSALTYAGGYLAKAARNSLKSRKAVSSPGSPPSIHQARYTGGTKQTVIGKNGRARTKLVGAKRNGLMNINYAVDQSALSLIVGPLAYNAKPVGYDNTVPHLLEFGGTVTVTQVRAGTRWKTLRAASVRSGRPTRTKTMNYAPRPFMGPALDRSREKLPGLWSATISG